MTAQSLVYVVTVPGHSHFHVPTSIHGTATTVAEALSREFGHAEVTYTKPGHGRTVDHYRAGQYVPFAR